MAGKASTTALSKAMRGEKVEGRQAQSALGQAVNRLANMTKKTEKTKDALAATGSMVIHTAETQGTLFLSSMAEGYLGKSKLELGGVDLRAPLGLLTQGFGLFETMSGKKGGGHALALGNGLVGSWLASVGVSAGQTLAQKRAGGQAANQAPQQQVPQTQMVTVTPAIQGAPGMLALPEPSLIPEPAVTGPLRKVLLTPEPEQDAAEADDDFEGAGRRRGFARHRGGRRRPMRGHRRPSRFVRAEQDEDDDLNE